MYTPSATYRLQLHKDFTLQQLEEIIGYLHDLGISTIYASPVTAAGSGSTHGYDVTDPHTINPEIGTYDQLKRITTCLKEKGMGWLQDIVPNHMAFSTANTRLMDALERDALSEFHGYFDIQWKHPVFNGKLMVPFLGEPLEETIEQGQIKIILTPQGFYVQCYEQQYPLSITAYFFLLSVFQLLAQGQEIPPTLNQLLDGNQQTAGFAKWQQHKAAIFKRLTSHAQQVELIEGWLAIINKDKELISQLLEVQYYRFCHWSQVNEVINYRRFFTISSLLCLRMEAAPVFEDYHRLLHQLYREGMVQGLRIDHIDGLYDPEEYIKRLRNLFGDDCYIIAEKILEGNEELPAAWLLQGTSGYEFLAEVSQLLTDRQGGARLALLYQSLLPGVLPFGRQAVQNKQMILDQYMQGEWDNLTRYFTELELVPYPGKWKEAIGACMAALPVYRIYPTKFPLSEQQQLLLEEAFALATQTTPACTKELKYLHALCCGPNGDPEEQQAILLFLKRLMQFTGPVMAKGVEDTTFYTWNGMIAHNEVGDTPLSLGSTIGQFHSKMKARQVATPWSLNATATHDTKRGEDARMRLNVLSRMPERWEQEVKRWFSINEPLGSIVGGEPAPSRNDEYFIYQSIIGGFPENGIVTEAWIERLQQYIQKVLREAKVKSNWEQPHLIYEQACMDFIHKLFDQDHAFMPRLSPFMQQVSEQAAIYSLSQLLVKITAPGIPDIYQGCELWDYSFVDPDNRRPVDYKRSSTYLRQIKEQESRGHGNLFPFLRTHRAQGLEKLFLAWKALHFRKANHEWFVKASYLPLTVINNKNIAVAYARQADRQWVIVIIPLLAERPIDHQEEYVELPEEAPEKWWHVLTGQTFTVNDRRLPLLDMWRLFPVALLRSA